jgi:serine/threonine protein kinase
MCFMTSQTTQSVLRNAALASGLLSPQQLNDAVASLADTESALQHSPDQITDELLGRRLVEQGYLNRWQVEQLKEGRTKFTLGPYRIVDALGRGGMGHVFKAEHKLLGRVEAIKVLPKSKSTPEAVAAFGREIRAQAQLDHPNLVRVTYAEFEGDTYFFVTEYVPGTDLRKLVRRSGPLPYPVAAAIISQAAEGLHYAHRRGLVHRDVKPGNLLVTPDGRTKITDLGLAWFLMDDLEGGTPIGKANSLVGTADYLAPETIRQPDKILPVSDVYSLGCTLYYAVTGKVPFPGGSTADKIRRHLAETPLNPLHFNPDLPDAFCDAIAAMMDKNPDARTPTAAAVVELLSLWRDEDATKQLLEPKSAGSGSRSNPASRVNLAPTLLEETASFVFDDAEPAPSPLESPSQISQGTLSLSSGTEDTLSGANATRRPAGRQKSETQGPTSQNRAEEQLTAPSGKWRKIVVALGLIAAAVAAAVIALL